MSDAMDKFVALSCSFLIFLTLLLTCVALETTPTKEPLHFDLDLYTQLLRRVEHLEKRDHEQQAEINTLRVELYEEKQRTSRLEGRLTRLQKTLGQLVGNRKASAVNDAIVVKQDNDKVGHGKDAVQKPGAQDNRVRRQSGTPIVAFNAHRGDYASNMGVHQTIVFDTVQVNVGNAYNPNLGAFIAPVSGIYVFHTTVVHSGDSLDFSIAINGVIMTNLHSGGNTSSSGMIVQHLNKDDVVTVQNESANRDYWGAGYNIFSGFLLHQDGAAGTIIG